MKQRVLAFTLAFVIFEILLTPRVFGGGAELSSYYGSRYLMLGGQQVVLATDAYAPFYNPAGLSEIEHLEMAIAFSPTLFQYEAPLAAANTQRNSEIGFGPLFYIGSGYKFNERFSFGLALFPTSLQGAKFTGVNFSSTLQDQTIEAVLSRIEISPSVAVKLWEHLSFGLSYRIAYNKLQKASGIFEVPGVLEGLAMRSSLSGWDAKGLKLGLLFHDWNRLSIALTYRIEVETTLEGKTTINNAVSLDSSQKMTVPRKIQASFAYEWVPDKILTAFTYEWLQNSKIENDTLRAPGLGNVLGVGGDLAIAPLHWSDSHTLHLGGEYKWRLSADEQWSFGTGLSLDLKTTDKTRPQPPLQPAATYIGGHLGAGYETGPYQYGLGLTYGQTLEAKTLTLASDVTPQTVFSGKYSLQVFLASLDFQYRF